MSKQPGGARFKLTEDYNGTTRLEAIPALIRGGVPELPAALSTGISEGTYYRWMREGEASHKAVTSHEEGDLSADQMEDEIEALLDVNGHKRKFWQDVTRARPSLERSLSAKWKKIVSEGVETRKEVWVTEWVEQGGGKPAVKVRFLKEETITKTGDGDYRGIAEYLLRRFPDRWQRTEKVEVKDVTPEGGMKARLAALISPTAGAAVLDELLGAESAEDGAEPEETP